MKKLLIIIDGMDDEPIPEFGGKTPVQAANMQALSFMRKHGTVNRVEAVPEGVTPSTDTALLTHLGYNVNTDFKSRAWFEAMGSGIDINPQDLCLRCNLISHDGEKLTTHNACNPTACQAQKYTKQLKSLNYKRFTIYNINGFRCLLVAHDTHSEICSIPPHELVGHSLDMLKVTSSDKKLEDELNSFIMESRLLPPVGKIGGVALWGAGTPFSAPFKTSGVVITAVPVVKGIAKAIGMKSIEVDGATGDVNTDYSAKLEAALSALRDNNFVLLHIEAPDEVSHAKNPIEKAHVLHTIDMKVILPLLKISMPLEIIIQADHGTSSLSGCHLSTPIEQIVYIPTK